MWPFGNVVLTDKVSGLESRIDTLKDERDKLKEDVADLKLKKKIEDEDIKHMIKMREEAQELELKGKTLDLEKDKAEAIAKVKDDYQKKVETNLEKELGKMDGMYKELLNRLPDISVMLGDRKEKKDA